MQPKFTSFFKYCLQYFAAMLNLDNLCLLIILYIVMSTVIEI